MRNVLIPTDFSPASLLLADKAIAALNDQNINIVLFHAFEKPCTSDDVLGNSRRLPYVHLLTDEFRSACKRLKATHARKVQNIHIRHLYGSTTPLFRNFIDANDIDTIVCLEGFEFVPVTKESVNPLRMFNKSGITLITKLERKQVFVPVEKEEQPLSDMVAVLIN